MNPTAKHAAGLFVQWSVFGVILCASYYAHFKPASEYLEYTRAKSHEAFEAFNKAVDGDPKAVTRLEELTHEGAGWKSYVMLSDIYKRAAIKDAGFDYNDPNANLELVDVSKSDNLMLRAMREETDLNLHSILYSWRLKFDDNEKNAMLEKSNGDTPYVSNFIKLESKSTFDQATKEKLLACFNKLDSRFSNVYKQSLGYSAIGGCSATPPDGAFWRVLKDYWNNVVAVSTSNDDNEPPQSHH
jgi:hypothetical protein